MKRIKRSDFKKFCRGDECIEMHPETWAKILLFLTKCGWKPSVPSFYFLSGNYDMSESDAKNISVIGQIVLEEAMKDPFGAYSSIDFDMGEFYEIVNFCGKGAFQICR